MCLCMANWQIHPKSDDLRGVDMIPEMRDCLILFVHLLVTVARLPGPGGLRSVVAESVLVRHQLLILNRGRKRAPNLRATVRIIAGLCTLFLRSSRVVRSAIVRKPSTLLHLHSVLRQRKYRMLFSPRRRRRPGPQGRNKDLIDAVVAMKRRNPGWGCPRIAQQISLAFGVEIDKDIVRRVLGVITGRNRIREVLPGFSGIIDGVALCRMFHRAIGGHNLPKYLSSDHDPLYRSTNGRLIFGSSG